MNMNRGHGFVYKPTYTDKRTGEKKTASIWWIQYFGKGTRFRESSNSRNRRDAETFLRRRIAEAAEGKSPPPRKLSFGQIEQLLSDDYRSRGRTTLARVQRAFGHLRPFFSKISLEQIDHGLTAAYARSREAAGAAPATINRELSALKRALRLAHLTASAASRPEFVKLQEANRRTAFFDAYEFAALIQNLPEYLRPVIHTAYVTGWRINSEILTRKKHHLDLDSGHLRIDAAETKDTIGRSFPLTPELLDVLKVQLSKTADLERTKGQIVPWLFHRDGKPIKDFRKAWKLACRRSRLEGKVPDDLRRTAVRNLERAGVSRATAMMLVGHRSDSIYRGISAVDHLTLKESAAKLAALHESEKGISD